MAAISQTTFSNAFSWIKSFVFGFKFGLEYGLDNSLAPNRRQAIFRTNADPIHWRIYAAPGGDELNLISTEMTP